MAENAGKLSILVTGGAGFIASHVVDRYIGFGHEVVVVDSLRSGKMENLNPKAVFYKMDIRDKAIGEVFEKHRFDIVNHHAAQIDVRKSVEDPLFDADINIMGLLNLLELSRTHRAKKFIYISSGGVVYGNPEKMPPSEDFLFAPESPYGVSKTTGEFYIRYYAKVHGLGFTALRYSNVFGPRQDPHGEAGVVAIFGRAMLKGEECRIFGDGEQTRDYVYVGDVADANVLALYKGNGESVNIGTGRKTSVNELFSLIAKVTGYPKKPVHMPKRQGELFENYLDVRKAEAVLGWRPKTVLKDGLKETVDWIGTGQG